MSRQSNIENYFKSKASVSNCSPKLDVKPMTDKKVKKRSLSLVKQVTPSKSPKVEVENGKVLVVNLCSDDEDDLEESPISGNPPHVDLTQQSNESEDADTAASDCSQNTVVYSPEKRLVKVEVQVELPQSSSSQFHDNPHCSTSKTETPNFEEPNLEATSLNGEICVNTEKSCIETPQKLQCNIETPQKDPEGFSTPHSSQATIHKSPQQRGKFFSPTKKRMVVNRSPNKVKRSLSSEMSRTLPSRILYEDDLFANACEGADDKTKFLLEIISKYLNEPSLTRLLDSKSQDLLTNCLQVVKPGMKLVCRVYWRQDKWYKLESLKSICSEEGELDDPAFQEMIESLLEHELIVQSSTKHMTFEDFTAILKKEDVQLICKELKLKMKNKEDGIKALESFSKSRNISNFLLGPTISNSKRVLDMMRDKTGCCYKLSDLARNTLHKLYILMYLGMDYSIIRQKKLELTVLYDKIKRQTYPIDKEMEIDNASIVFRTKYEFDRYVTAHNKFEDFLTLTNSIGDLPKKCDIVMQAFEMYKNISEEEMACYTSLPPWLYRYTPANLYIKILESGIQDLKRVKSQEQLSLALDILSCLIKQNSFRQHKKADWYSEKAHILHSMLSQYDEAAEVLLQGFRSDMSEEIKDSMRPRARKIANQKNTTLSEHLEKDLLQFANKEDILEKNLGGKHIYERPKERINKRGKVEFESRSPGGGRMMQQAEEYCIGNYIAEGEFTNGEHWEGRIVTSIFFLLFWDIVYSKPLGVRGVFLSQYQLYPLDLFTDSFYKNRKEAIEEWLNFIETASEEKLLNIMRERWDDRPEYELSGLFRDSIKWDHIRAVSSCLGPRGLASICRRLAKNYRYAHSGFPDLTLWNPGTKRIKFVEVKTDSDKPSIKQIQWMQYLRQHSIETEFCYVGVNTTRQRCRTRLTLESPVTMEF